MSVVAQGIRLSEQPQAHTASVRPYADHGLEGSTWPPFAETISRSSAAQPEMPPDASGPWRANFGEDDLMSIVAGSARRSQPPQQFSPAAPLPLLAGDRSAGSSRQISNIAETPLAVPATEQPSSGAHPSPLWASRLSEKEFKDLTDAVISGASVVQAIQSIGRTDLPATTVQRWLSRAGVSTTYRRGRRPSLSVAQIEAAQQALADHIRQTGSTDGSIDAIHRALGTHSVTLGTLQTYFRGDGLTDHGKKMLELTRMAESRAARHGISGPQP